jgi:hypothetical protein
MSHLKKRKSAHEERNESKLSINPEGDVEFNPDELILMNRFLTRSKSKKLIFFSYPSFTNKINILITSL